MKIVVVNGTEKHGVTYRLKELFLERFRADAKIVEYDLPKDCPVFCAGCTQCIVNGEAACKDAAYIHEIEKTLLTADLIVMTSPAYVLHATGAMKSLLDHFAYRWMPHRPAPEMFKKRAVVITQCVGAGAKSAAKDIRHSLSWWGISQISTFTGVLINDIVWERLKEKKQRKLTCKIKRLSEKFARMDGTKPPRTRTVTKVKFLFCRAMQKKLHAHDPASLDGQYWAEQGWLGKQRPWKHTNDSFTRNI